MTNRRTFLGHAAAVAGAAVLPVPAHAQNRAATIKAKDTDIHVKDFGAGRPVILTHAWPLSADIWEAQAAALARAGYRAVASTAAASGAPANRPPPTTSTPSRTISRR